ncbi:MAG: hypothetical protein WBE26_05430 [Phycisphaerae bacterium]
MGFGQLRRYDVQAKCALVLSLVSTVPFLGAVALMLRNFDRELGQIIYGSKGSYLPALLGCLLLSMIPSTIGFFLGWSSAGQRRNDRPMHSWIGFFVGGGVLTFDLVLLIAFWMLRLQQPV